MNLVTDNWMPVVTEKSSKELVSLEENFLHGQQIRDLAVNPPQRIALMRLLICITQAALDGPEDEEDWFYCKPDIPQKASDYLDKWKSKFELYGNDAFMQIAELICNKGGERALDALDCRSPQGGSATPLFQQEENKKTHSCSAAENVINLLTYLNFSTGGKVGQAKWKGVQYNGSTFAAPCIKTTHTFVRGGNLLETIHLNLLTKQGNRNGVDALPNGAWGQPVWEKFPQTPEDESALKNATATYLGRLVPLSRLVKLSPQHDSCIAGPPPKTFQIKHLPGYREPSTTVFETKKGDLQYLSVSSSKHIWRQLGAILATQKTEKKSGAVPLSAVEMYAEHMGIDQLDIWVGGLELGKQAGKLNDFVEWVFSVPVNALKKNTLLRYEKGVQLADAGALSLKNTVKTYYKNMHVDPKSVSHAASQNYYWSTLDNDCPILLETVTDENARLNDTWYPLVFKAMNRAFEFACPHTTPRQIMAFATAKKNLKLKKLENA